MNLNICIYKVMLPVLCLLEIMLLVFLIVPSTAVIAADSSEKVSTEITQLISFVENSNCKFNRNGRWYSGEEAAKHISKKYLYVKKRGLIKTAEDFIHYAASKSSMSGKVYKVQCNDRELITCSDWLTAELKNYREVQ